MWLELKNKRRRKNTKRKGCDRMGYMKKMQLGANGTYHWQRATEKPHLGISALEFRVSTATLPLSVDQQGRSRHEPVARYLRVRQQHDIDGERLLS